MLKNDYILRMIEQMADILRAVLQKKESGRYEECRQKLEQGYKLLGLSRRLASTMPCEQLLWLLNRFGPAEEERPLALARLLEADAQVSLAEGRTAEARGFLRTAGGVLASLLSREDLSDRSPVQEFEDTVKEQLRKLPSNS